MATLLLASLAAPEAVRVAAPWLLAAGILAGVPHGAVDHLIPLWTARHRPATAAVAAVAYLVAVLAVGAALLRWPGPMLLAFLALSVWHFGTGEAEFAAERDGTTTGRGARWLATAGVGLPVVAVAVLGDAERTRAVLTALGVAGWPLDRPGARAVVAAAAVLGVLVATGVTLAGGRRRLAAEVLLIAGVLAASPPAAAFGVYFGCWHAVRHTARLLARTPSTQDGGPPEVLGRFARSAAVPSAVALVALAMLWSRREVADPTAAVAVLLALTFPHAVVVAWLDRSRPT